MTRRHTTRREDLAFLLRRLGEATRTWAPGDPCCTYRGRTDDPACWTTVLRVDGDTVHLTNGDHMHRSHMRLRADGGR